MRISWVEEPYETTPAGAYGKTGGVDWHNLTAVFPSGVLGPHHPWIDSSLRRWRHAYVEGVFPYAKDGDYSLAHNYNSLNLAETWLRRGDHAEALRDLYGAVLHTSATHASAEVADTSGRLDFNCTPHNWFSAKLIRFIRDCLVYEDGDGFLHLLAGLSPAWMKGGMTVGVENAPTEYGVFTFNTVMADRGFSMVLKCSTGERPPVRAFEGYVLHLPPFLIDPVIEVSGRDLPVRNGQCRLMSDVREIHVRWTNVKLPDISFHRVVASYLADYTKRLEELNGRTG